LIYEYDEGDIYVFSLDRFEDKPRIVRCFDRDEFWEWVTKNTQNRYSKSKYFKLSFEKIIKNDVKEFLQSKLDEIKNLKIKKWQTTSGQKHKKRKFIGSQKKV
jgi:hypothetical protein